MKFIKYYNTENDYLVETSMNSCFSNFLNREYQSLQGFLWLNQYNQQYIVIIDEFVIESYK